MTLFHNIGRGHYLPCNTYCLGHYWPLIDKVGLKLEQLIFFFLYADRLKLAIKSKQKSFVAHRNVQQLLGKSLTWRKEREGQDESRRCFICTNLSCIMGFSVQIITYYQYIKYTWHNCMATGAISFPYFLNRVLPDDLCCSDSNMLQVVSYSATYYWEFPN